MYNVKDYGGSFESAQQAAVINGGGVIYYPDELVHIPLQAILYMIQSDIATSGVYYFHFKRNKNINYLFTPRLSPTPNLVKRTASSGWCLSIPLLHNLK